MTAYTLDDFYTVVREIVTHMKAVRECDRINSLVIVNSKFTLGKDYVQKERSPYYFSRDNSQLVYPSLIISESFKSYDKYENGRYKRDCQVLEIGVVDQHHEDCTDCDECGKRNDEQIKHDVETLLKKVITEISNIRLYKTQPNDVLVFSVPALMSQYITDGRYVSAVEVTPETSLLKKIWKDTNQTKRSIPYMNKTMSLYGTFLVTTICQLCNNLNVEYKIKKIEKEIC